MAVKDVIIAVQNEKEDYKYDSNETKVTVTAKDINGGGGGYKPPVDVDDNDDITPGNGGDNTGNGGDSTDNGDNGSDITDNGNDNSNENISNSFIPTDSNNNDNDIIPVDNKNDDIQTAFVLPEGITVQLGDNRLVYLFDENLISFAIITFDDYISRNFNNIVPLGRGDIEKVNFVKANAKVNPKTDVPSTLPYGLGIIIITIGILAVFIRKSKLTIIK